MSNGKCDIDVIFINQELDKKLHNLNLINKYRPKYNYFYNLNNDLITIELLKKNMSNDIKVDNKKYFYNLKYYNNKCDFFEYNFNLYDDIIDLNIIQKSKIKYIDIINNNYNIMYKYKFKIIRQINNVNIDILTNKEIVDSQNLNNINNQKWITFIFEIDNFNDEQYKIIDYIDMDNCYIFFKNNNDYYTIIYNDVNELIYYKIDYKNKKIINNTEIVINIDKFLLKNNRYNFILIKKLINVYNNIYLNYDKFNLCLELFNNNNNDNTKIFYNFNNNKLNISYQNLIGGNDDLEKDNYIIEQNINFYIDQNKNFNTEQNKNYNNIDFDDKNNIDIDKMLFNIKNKTKINDNTNVCDVNNFLTELNKKINYDDKIKNNSYFYDKCEKIYIKSMTKFIKNNDNDKDNYQLIINLNYKNYTFENNNNIDKKFKNVNINEYYVNHTNNDKTYELNKIYYNEKHKLFKYSLFSKDFEELFKNDKDNLLTFIFEFLYNNINE